MGEGLIFSEQLASVRKLKGGERLAERSKVLVEKYPRVSRGMSVDAAIASHKLLKIALNPKERKKYTIKQINEIAHEIYIDQQLCKNERRKIAERDAALILATINEKMNPLLTGQNNPEHIHHELVELGITSLDILERFVDEIPRRADGYRGLIERIGKICYENGYGDDVMPMLNSSLEIIGNMRLQNDENVGAQLYVMHSSLERTKSIISTLHSKKTFETPGVRELRETVITVYIKRGIVTADNFDLTKASSVLKSFELLDDELKDALKDRRETITGNILEQIIEANNRISEIWREKNPEIITNIVTKIKSTISALKK